ncbi:MAG: NAD(P)-dependent oxidoreductase [Nitriliruptor sp.]|uniref:NAD-dependent epimerase/dehydratase family protein n=1 Tax=Nitriliruptor sp. TaxID=2448056 RepID=UPI0034A06CE5
MGTVVVTGATGFVGGRVARRLRDRGDEVIAAVRRPSDELAALGVDQRTVALGDLEGLQEAGREAAAVVHAAAVAGPDRATARAVNVDGTQAVAGAALLSGQRLIHVSTTSVYDLAAIGDREVVEDDPLVARDGEAPPTSSSGNAYATTKALAEEVVERAVSTGLAATILRPPAVLGAGPTSTWGTRIPARVRDGDGPAIHREGTFGWVHVEDLVDAILAALDADVEVVRGLTVNVVGGHVTFGEYRDAVADRMGGAPPPPPDPDVVWRGTYATRQLGANLDVQPARTFEDAMDEIADSWPDGGPRG